MTTVGMRATDAKDLRKNPLIVFTRTGRGYVPRRVRADRASEHRASLVSGIAIQRHPTAIEATADSARKAAS